MYNKDYLEKINHIIKNEDVRSAYRMLFGENVNYDTERKQIKGIKKLFDEFYNDAKKDSEQLDYEFKNYNCNYNNGTVEIEKESNSSFGVDNTKDEETILKENGFDPKAWVLVQAQNISKDGKNITKIKVKKNEREKIEKNVGSLIELIRTPKRKANYVAENNDMLFIPCIFDAHFGRMFVDSAIDYNIIMDRTMQCLHQITEGLSGVKKIVLPIGNDFFNSEYDGKTTKGTPQSNSLEYDEIFKLGTALLVAVIDELAEIAPVEVVLIQGNHSSHNEFYASCFLSAYYREDERVTIDTTTHSRKYIRFGENLIGFCHGDKEKSNIYSLMQVERTKDWGETKNHEFILGHEHHEEVVEKNGVTVRKMPTITSADKWSFENGYTMSQHKMIGLVYDIKKGLVCAKYSTYEK